jgi:hypothetical protein
MPHNTARAVFLRASSINEKAGDVEHVIDELRTEPARRRRQEVVTAAVQSMKARGLEGWTPKPRHSSSKNALRPGQRHRLFHELAVTVNV